MPVLKLLVVRRWPRLASACILAIVAAGLLAACGESSSDEEKPVVGEMSQPTASEIKSVEVTDLIDKSPPEVPATDKQSVITYTQKNKRIGDRIGSPGGVIGLVPMDASALTQGEQQALEQARKALADHLELPDVNDAELVEISAQQWRDSSVGCARSGEMSAQVLTDGYKVVLVLAGLRHQVHTGRRGGRVCERLQGMLQAPRRSLTLSALPRLQRAAMADLAGRMGVDEAEIRAGRVTPGSWPDASMGCPEPGEEYAKVQTGGYILPMTFKGRTVNYRTDGQRVVGCEGIEMLVPQDK